MIILAFVLCLLEFVIGAPSAKHPYSLDGRIVGGRDADIADYPYQIALLYDDFQFCGGAIISPKWVITAAHCVDDFDDPDFQIRAGSSKAERDGEVVNVSRIIAHPKFDDDLDYDVALLELSSEITIENASVINLPLLSAEDATIPVGATVTVTGWGYTDEEQTDPDVLQVVEVPVVSQDDCQKSYEDVLVSARMFCAGFLETGGKDACQGDSGGPATIDGVLTGLVSWGMGCAEPHYPGVYTNLVVLRSWINEVSDI